jgi:hypothetical protein
MPRHLSPESFADGTTIDGNRIERALGDIEGRVNSVPTRDLAKYCVPVTRCNALHPQDPFLAARHNMPWMLTLNDVDSIHTTAPEGYANPLRHKGVNVPGVNLGADGSAKEGEQYAWDQEWTFVRPVVLDTLSLLVVLDNPNADNRSSFLGDASQSGKPFQWVDQSVGAPPEGYSVDDDADDIVVLMSMQSPFAPNDRTQDNVILIKKRWVINKHRWTRFALPVNPAAGYNDMAPGYLSTTVTTSAESIDGRGLVMRGLNIPIPQRTTVRLSVVIPQYDGTVIDRSYWGAKPWYLAQWMTSITTMEALWQR